MRSWSQACLDLGPVHARRADIPDAAGSTIQRYLVQTVNVVVGYCPGSRKTVLERRSPKFDLRKFVQRLGEVLKVKDSIPRRGTVYEHYPTLATLLRNVLLQHPEMRLLIEALSKFNTDTIHLPDLIERLVWQYPNVFLNLFCTGQGRETARELIENGSMETLYMDDDMWRDVIRTNIVFNFTHQLRHAGILTSDTVGHGSAFAEYDPDAKPWHLNRQTLRDI